MRDNPFEEFLTDTIYLLRPDNTLLGPLKAQVDRNKIHLHETSYAISNADKIIRHLPNGAKETFAILNAHFSQGFYDIPAAYELTTEKPVV